MGDRRVSVSPPEARLRCPGTSEEADRTAAGVRPHRGLPSSKASACAPVTATASTRVHPGQLGGADRPPAAAKQASDFPTAYRELRDMVNRYSNQPESEIYRDVSSVCRRLSRRVLNAYDDYCGDARELRWPYGKWTKTQLAYELVLKQSRQAEKDHNDERASAIRRILNDIDRRVAQERRTLVEIHGLAGLSSTQTPQRTPETTAQAVDWCLAYRQLAGISEYFKKAGHSDDAARFKSAVLRMDGIVNYRFYGLSKQRRPKLLAPCPGHPSPSEQKYRIFEDTVLEAEAAGESLQADRLRQLLDTMNEKARRELSSLSSQFGPIEELAARAGLSDRWAPATAGPTVSSATAQAIGAPLRAVKPVPTPGSVAVPPPSAPRRPETGAAAVPFLAGLLSEPPGPSSRVLPAQAPARAVPPARREAIVEHFRSDAALFYAGFTLGVSGAETLGWAATRTQRVLDDLDRLHGSAGENPAAAAALTDIDWSGIEALMGMLDVPPRSP